MRLLSSLPVLPLSTLLVSVVAFSKGATNSTCNQQCQIDHQLGPLLSEHASIVHSTAAVPRWSEFVAPDPGTVVNVATEHDVLVTVQYCLVNKISFLAQNGGTAWSTTFRINRKDVLINLRGIRQITFNADKTEITFQGGAITSEVVNAAYGNGTQVLTGNCNCVGTLGAVLGGGFGRLMGLYGLGVDNVLSLNLITSFGAAITVNPKNEELWWAVRGAGANFGIVTSVTMKAYPVPVAENGAWVGALIFTEDKIEALVQTINDLDLQPRMAIFLYYGTSGAPNYTPTVIAIPFYLGTVSEGKAAFSSIYAVGPAADLTSWQPYNVVNADSEAFCVKGSRKPSYGAGLGRMDPVTWRTIWNEYKDFLRIPGTGNSSVLLEAYSLYKTKSFGDASSSYAFRSTVRYNAVAIPWYADPALDSKAEAFGSSIRDLWRATDALSSNSTYINFAFGDESLQTIYGENVARLRVLKKKYDASGQFNQFFPLSKGPNKVRGFRSSSMAKEEQ